MKTAFILFAPLLFIHPLSAAEPNPLAEFSTVAAKSAVEKFNKKLAFLDERLAEQVALAEKALRVDVQLALDEAVKQQDFPEVERLSKFLQSTDIKPKGEMQSDVETIASLKSQLEQLKAQLAILSAPAPFVGTWKHPDGRSYDYLADGRVMRGEQMVGIWRQFAVDSYLAVYRDGSSDEMKLQRGGNTIRALTKTGKPFEMFRVTKP
jgi:hypothetical protein